MLNFPYSLKWASKVKAVFIFKRSIARKADASTKIMGQSIDKDSDCDLPPDLLDHQKIRVSHIKDLLDNFERAGLLAGSEVPRSTCVG
jgi:hypothetical protein